MPGLEDGLRLRGFLHARGDLRSPHEYSHVPRLPPPIPTILRGVYRPLDFYNNIKVQNGVFPSIIVFVARR